MYHLHSAAATAAKLLRSCLTLWDPIDGSPPGSPVPGILQARTLEWVAISFSNASKWKGKVKSLSHVWLNDPMNCSLPGSSVHGIFQARVLEWVAIAFSNLHSGKCKIICDPRQKRDHQLPGTRSGETGWLPRAQGGWWACSRSEQCWWLYSCTLERVSF